MAERVTPLPRPKKYKSSKYIKYVNLIDKPVNELLYYLLDRNFIEGEIKQYKIGEYSAHLLIHKKKKR